MPQSRPTADHVLITGTSSGIGRATVFALAQEGYFVLAGVRKPADAESLAAEATQRGLSHLVTPLLLDITKDSHILEAAMTVRRRLGETGGRFHALVNNAGALVAGPVEAMPMAQWRHQFDLLLFGQVALIQALLPEIRSARGRIINVTSIGGIAPTPMIGAYQAAKAAFEALSDSLRLEMAPLGVKVVAVAPGAIRTPLLQRSMNQFEVAADQLSPELQPAYGDHLRAFGKIASSFDRNAIAPERAAATLLRAVSARRPRTRYLIGADARLLALLKRNLPDSMMDGLVRWLIGFPSTGAASAT